MTNNQVALHTPPGCYQAQNPGQTGVTLEGDCSKDQGCIVAETKPNSYGPGFAAAGGGVYAIQIAASGIYSWFWSVCFRYFQIFMVFNGLQRPDIPDNVKLSTSTSSIDTGVWGLPSSAYPASACNITQFFPPQNLVLLTTLCGVWCVLFFATILPLYFVSYATLGLEYQIFIERPARRLPILV